MAATAHCARRSVMIGLRPRNGPYSDPKVEIAAARPVGDDLPLVTTEIWTTTPCLATRPYRRPRQLPNPPPFGLHWPPTEHPPEPIKETRALTCATRPLERPEQPWPTARSGMT